MSPDPIPITPAVYTRMARLLRRMEDQLPAQPTLEQLASDAGISPFWLHRQFTRAVGLTPKKLLQALTVEYCKARLTESVDVLSVALEAGLSGPSRMHDLMVRFEALSPGEYARAAEGITAHWGVHETAVGRVMLVVTPRGIAHLQFLTDQPEEVALAEGTRSLRHARIVRDEGATGPYLESLEGGRGDVLGWVPGTPFQIAVWRALLAIPEGSVTTYERIAAAAGRPKAVRAAASAVGDNPLAWLIPCHRVVRKSGELGGYRWGLDAKMALLAQEAGSLPD